MLRRYLILATIFVFLTGGCRFSDQALIEPNLPAPSLEEYFGEPNLSPSDPTICDVASLAALEHGPLDDFNFSNPENYLRTSLAECINVALQDSPVVRDLGGLVLRAPDAVSTTFDPSIVYTDPRFGEEAALSEFDADLNGQLLFQKNDRFYNNQFIGNEGASQQDLARYFLGISKLAATGARFEFNQVIDYDLNNSPSNRFNDRDERSFAYDTHFEAFFRQPLLQGYGTTFNRIAGPNNAPGVNRGVLIARSNTDIALAEFESQIQNLISDIENAYWDLYFAYRDLEAKIEARNGAYDIWRNLEANKGEKSAAIIGQAKEQYFRFAADVEDAIHGRPVEGTRTNNGSAAGTFRRIGGVRSSERRLRLIIGMPLNGDQLIVPTDMPIDADLVFDWEQSKTEALSFRPELRRQRWLLKRRELELLASKNFLLPRLDLLGKYRLQGFGHKLFGDGNEFNPNGTVEEQLDSSAFGTLLNGNLQEWELGVDMSVPIGYRQQFAAKRNAELFLARERAVLNEQQRQVLYGLSNALGELKRTTNVRFANENRLAAAEEQFNAIQNIWREQDTTIDLVLEAQRRVIESKIQYFQTQVDTMLAIKSVHYEKGTLFDYHSITLTEGESNREAQIQANDSRRRKRTVNYSIPGLMIGQPISTNSAVQTPMHQATQLPPEREWIVPTSNLPPSQPGNFELPTSENVPPLPAANISPTPAVGNVIHQTSHQTPVMMPPIVVPEANQSVEVAPPMPIFEFKFSDESLAR